MNWERQRYPWKFRSGELILGARTLIMGVLDLFAASGEGKDRVDAGKALGEALLLQQQGADIIDVSAHAPLGAQRQTCDDELRRLVPVLRKLRGRLDVPLCVSSWWAATAARVLELDADILYDPTGLSFDAELARAVNRGGGGLIVAHMQGAPETWGKPAPEARSASGVAQDLDSCLARARRAGIDRRRVVIDPGLQQGKRGLENHELLVDLGQLASLGSPILVNLRGGGFLTETVRASEHERSVAAVTALTAAVGGGAHIIRVERVEEMVLAARAADRYLEAAERE